MVHGGVAKGKKPDFEGPAKQTACCHPQKCMLVVILEAGRALRQHLSPDDLGFVEVVR